MASSAAAQAPQPPPADPAEARPDPVAEARIHLGVVGLTPRFALTNFGVDDNVFNSTDDPRRDFTFTTSPAVGLWLRTARGLLSVDGRLDLVYFATYANQRSANGAGTVRYEYPLTRVMPYVSFSALTTRERPGYEIDLRARRFEDSLDVGTLVTVGSASTVEIARRRQQITFRDEDVFQGQELKQVLDRTLTSLEVAWRQRLTVLTTWVVRTAREHQRFEFQPDRDSNSTRVTTGFEFGALALIRGQAFVGYRHLRGAAGAALQDFSGLTADVNVSYEAPSQSRLQLATSRDVQYSFDDVTPYYVQTGWTATLTQRVIGQWEAQVSGGRDRLSYRGHDAGGGRLDRILRIGGGVGYRLGESARIGVDVVSQRRRSPLSAREYKALKTGLSVTYDY